MGRIRCIEDLTWEEVEELEKKRFDKSKTSEEYRELLEETSREMMYHAKEMQKKIKAFDFALYGYSVHNDENFYYSTTADGFWDYFRTQMNNIDALVEYFEQVYEDVDGYYDGRTIDLYKLTGGYW